MVRLAHDADAIGRSSPHSRGDGPAGGKPMRKKLRSPHSRGDGPAWRRRTGSSTTFSPLAWGWSALSGHGACGQWVLPTRVGMVRRVERCLARGSSVPRTPGDGPARHYRQRTPIACSPHAWGWSAERSGGMKLDEVSLHAWGLSDHADDGMVTSDVSPLRAGIVRRWGRSRRNRFRVPHTRGDEPSGNWACSMSSRVHMRGIVRMRRTKTWQRHPSQTPVPPAGGHSFHQAQHRTRLINACKHVNRVAHNQPD
ncbi:MAG: hypothetical protein JWO89_3729 [Verrucomicrobiaceae bacterium]|nr:hypothetical protein [Verrucomicrobiaceae bacterium]